MGRMKDYSMWLEDHGYAEWNEHLGDLVMLTEKAPDELFNEYRADQAWHNPQPTRNDDV